MWDMNLYLQILDITFLFKVNQNIQKKYRLDHASTETLKSVPSIVATFAVAALDLCARIVDSAISMGPLLRRFIRDPSTWLFPILLFIMEEPPSTLKSDPEMVG